MTRNEGRVTTLLHGTEQNLRAKRKEQPTAAGNKEDKLPPRKCDKKQTVSCTP